MGSKNNRQAYFNTLTRVSKKVDDVLREFWKNDKYGEAKLIMYEPFLKKKWGAQKLRPILTWLSYCALTDTHPNEDIPKDIAKLAAATDLELYAEYTANWNFDNKGEVRTNPLNRQKAAVASKSFLEDAVRMVSQVDEKYVPIILDTSSEVTNSWAKELELNMSNPEWETMPLQRYMKAYIEDFCIPGIGKTLSPASDLTALYTDKTNTTQARQLHNALLNYGVELEILNDLGDFCMEEVSNDKRASDQFSDVKNGVLTPPIWLMYNTANEQQREIIRNCVRPDELTKQEEKELVNILFETGTYNTVSKGLKSAGRKLQKEIKRIGFENEAAKQLRLAASVFESSKIYHILKKSYKAASGQNTSSTENNKHHDEYMQIIRGRYSGA